MVLKGIWQSGRVIWLITKSDYQRGCFLHLVLRLGVEAGATLPEEGEVGSSCKGVAFCFAEI